MVSRPPPEVNAEVGVIALIVGTAENSDTIDEENERAKRGESVTTAGAY
jgi:hypothetical protein